MAHQIRCAITVFMLNGPATEGQGVMQLGEGCDPESAHAEYEERHQDQDSKLFHKSIPFYKWTVLSILHGFVVTGNSLNRFVTNPSLKIC